MRVAGVDEVGRGPLAGPVVTAAVVLLEPIAGLADSKSLSAARRDRLARDIRARARWALGAASVGEIARLDVRKATLLAMRRAVLRLGLTLDLVLVDGRDLPDLPYPARAVIGGDASEPSIAAASILAKTVRDRLMARLAARWPGYGWEVNAGYPTAAHRAALLRLGVSPHHRTGFAPVRALLSRGPGPQAAKRTGVSAATATAGPSSSSSTTRSVPKPLKPVRSAFE
jgi:ribonuclease HII